MTNITWSEFPAIEIILLIHYQLLDYFDCYLNWHKHIDVLVTSYLKIFYVRQVLVISIVLTSKEAAGPSKIFHSIDTGQKNKSAPNNDPAAASKLFLFLVINQLVISFFY